MNRVSIIQPENFTESSTEIDEFKGLHFTPPREVQDQDRYIHELSVSVFAEAALRLYPEI